MSPLPGLPMGMSPEVVETIAARLEDPKVRALAYGPAMLALTFVSMDDAWPVFQSWVQNLHTTQELGHAPTFTDDEHGQDELKEHIRTFACWLAVHAPGIASALREELGGTQDPGPGPAPVG